MYTTVAQVKAEVKIDGASDDDLLIGYVALAQRVIEAPRPLGTGRVFEVAVDTTRYLDAPIESDARLEGPSYLLLLMPAGDLCSITSVVNGDGTTVSASDYVTEPRNTTPYYGLRLKSNSGITWAASSTGNPEGAIAITGKWAYSASAPVDIQRAALRLCVWWYKERDNAGFDKDIQTDDGMILANKMPRDIRQILETYWTVV